MTTCALHYIIVKSVRCIVCTGAVRTGYAVIATDDVRERNLTIVFMHAVSAGCGKEKKN